MHRVPVQKHRKMLGMRPILYQYDFLVPYIDLYTEEQMKEVFLGVQSYQKKYQVELYIDPDLSAQQMHQLRLGVDEELPYRILKLFSNPRVSWLTIRKYRLAWAKIVH